MNTQGLSLRLRRAILMLLLGALQGQAGAQQPPPVQWLSEAFPPFSFETPAGPRGLAIEMLRASLAQAGLPPAQPLFVPWARVLNTLASGAPACVTTMTRTPQREARYRWVGTLLPDTIVAGRLPEAPPWPAQPASWPGLSVVVIRGDVSEEVARSLGVPDQNVQRVGNPTNAVRMVLARRVDAWLHSDVGIRWTLLGMGLPAERLRLDGGTRVGDNYFACSQNVSPDYVARLQKGLDGIKRAPKSGASDYELIVARYLKAR